MKNNPLPRQLAFEALMKIYLQGAYTDLTVNNLLTKNTLNSLDRSFICELVYGIVRRQRSLDSLVTQLGSKPAEKQNPKLRIILHLGLYQLRYLNQIPPSAAVNTSVELAKTNGLGKLASVVNGLLRQYLRLATNNNDPLNLPTESISRLGVLYSLPNWIVEIFHQQLDIEAVEQLCNYFNQAPTIDLRINPLITSIETVETAFLAAGIKTTRIPYLPQALRLTDNVGAITNLPGFLEGWFTVQDSSAQLVSHFLAPQPEEIIIDTCAAPGGKTSHIGELMQDRGHIWACDYHPHRLQKVQQNGERLKLQSIKICAGDSRNLPQFKGMADRVLLDAPCSGLGTLHKRPDIRWRQTLAQIQELSLLQTQLLENAQTWVKPGGVLVYATCTINPTENEQIIEQFLSKYPQWQIEQPSLNLVPSSWITNQGAIKIWSHLHQMDSFFMVKLIKE